MEVTFYGNTAKSAIKITSKEDVARAFYANAYFETQSEADAHKGEMNAVATSLGWLGEAVVVKQPQMSIDDAIKNPAIYELRKTSPFKLSISRDVRTNTEKKALTLAEVKAICGLV